MLDVRVPVEGEGRRREEREEREGERERESERKRERSRARRVSVRTLTHAARSTPRSTRLSHKRREANKRNDHDRHTHLIHFVGLWMNMKDRFRGYSKPALFLNAQSMHCAPRDVLKLPAVKIFFFVRTLNVFATSTCIGPFISGASPEASPYLEGGREGGEDAGGEENDRENERTATATASERAGTTTHCSFNSS